MLKYNPRRIPGKIAGGWHILAGVVVTGVGEVFVKWLVGRLQVEQQVGDKFIQLKQVLGLQGQDSQVILQIWRIGASALPGCERSFGRPFTSTFLCSFLLSQKKSAGIYPHLNHLPCQS